MWRVIGLVSLLLAGVACAAPAAPPPSAAPAAVPTPSAVPRERVTVLYPNQGANQTATWLAQEAGLYAKHGLEVDLQFLEGSPSVMQAMAAGNAQFAVVGTTASISAGLRGLDVVLIATAQPGLIYTLWTNGITRVQDLPGKRIATGRINTDPDFALRLLLDRLNLRYNEDVTVVHVDAGGEVARIAAVQAGGADALMLTAGYGPRVRQLGYIPLIDLTAERIPYEAATVVTTRTFAASKPHAVRGFVQAFIEAIALAKRERPLVLELYRKYARLDDPEIAAEWYEAYVERVFPDAPFVSEAGIQTVLDLLARTEPQLANVRPADYIDNRYVEEVCGPPTPARTCAGAR
ncbi:MAG TPA: ABC transporter substrate-binding protein [Chloroflexota bacterium]|nr:ABC transporter substrate-binding protein [Chloroflexota bacterium]